MIKPGQKAILSILLIKLSIILSCYVAYAGSLVLTGDSRGSYVLTGSELVNMTSLVVTTTFDTSALATPRVSHGHLLARFSLASSTDQPGIVRITAARKQPVNGSGILLDIRFEQLGSYHKGIFSADALLTDINGAKSQLPIEIVYPADKETVDSAPQEQAAPQRSDPVAFSRSSSYTPQPETVSLSGARQETVAQDAAVQSPTTVTPVRETIKPRNVVFKGVMERFLESSGKGGLQEIIRQYRLDVGAKISQEPDLLITDGLSSLKIIVPCQEYPDDTPVFILNSVKLRNLILDDGKNWVLELVPEIGSFNASLTVQTKNTITYFPVTVSPALEQLTVDPADGSFIAKNGIRLPSYLTSYIKAANSPALKGNSQ